MDNRELQHYGVKGMKWGVIRYSKDAGSYTKKGVKKFNDTLKKYDSAKQNLKDSKNSGDKDRIKSDKQAVKVVKSQLKKDYKQLKKDNLVDQGKVLHQKGKTISSNKRINMASQVSIAVGSRVVNSILRSSGNAKTAKLATSVISVGGAAVNTMLSVKTRRDNKKLRAYYSRDR